MITAKDITFICHVRIDNGLREKNIKTIYEYYSKHLPGCKFIFVEDDDYEKLEGVIDFFPKDRWLRTEFIESQRIINKCDSYNYGAELSETDIMIFLDVDIIVDCDKLLECLNAADKIECLIGYNGIAFYMTEEGEKKFLETLDVNDLYYNVSNLEARTGSSNSCGVVGNTKAVGGCLIMTKESFKAINGFNPFFWGWGYEDNEIISRAHILGLNVCRSGVAGHFLYHLPHETEPNRNKADHSHYKQNEAICQFVESLNKEQLKRYIKQW